MSSLAARCTILAQFCAQTAWAWCIRTGAAILPTHAAIKNPDCRCGPGRRTGYRYAAPQRIYRVDCARWRGRLLALPEAATIQEILGRRADPRAPPHPPSPFLCGACG